MIIRRRTLLSAIVGASQTSWASPASADSGPLVPIEEAARCLHRILIDQVTTGHTAVDAFDIYQVLSGGAIRTTRGRASGEDRIQLAAMQAVQDQGQAFNRSVGGVIVIIAGAFGGFRRADSYETYKTVRTQARADSYIIYGTYHDAALEGAMEITLIAAWDRPHIGLL